MTDSGPEDSISCWSGTVSKRADMLADCGHSEPTVGPGAPLCSACRGLHPGSPWPHLRGPGQDFELGLGREPHSLLAWALGLGLLCS